MKRLKRIIRYSLPLYIVLLLTSVLPNAGWATRVRGVLISPFVGKCGTKFRVAKGVTLINTEGLSIGDNVYIGHNVWINSIGKCTINSNVLIGPMTLISTSNHQWNGNSFNGVSKTSPVVIGEGTWVASHCIITAGSEIGNGTLVAANTLVTGKFPNHVLLAGTPCQIKKNLNNA